MADIFPREKRSEIMGKIKSENTQPEIIIRKLLFSHGFRFRLHKKGLPGKPDIVLKKYRTVIFVNGCFWHGHPCKIGSGNRTPKTNSEYWRNKILRNKQRDKKNRRKLQQIGWRVMTLWECQILLEKTLYRKLKPLLERKSNA